MPPQRYGHTCACYNGRIFMYGGRNDDDGSFKVVECFDIGKRLWLVSLYCDSFLELESFVIRHILEC